MKIGELAALTGVAERQVRYLIAEGFIPAPRGGRANADYGDEHVAAIGRYNRLRDLGFRRQPSSCCSKPARRAVSGGPRHHARRRPGSARQRHRRRPAARADRNPAVGPDEKRTHEHAAPQSRIDPLRAFIAGGFEAGTPRPVPLVATRFDVLIEDGLAG